VTKRAGPKVPKLTEDEYIDLLAFQNGRCAICGRPPKNRRLNVDHDHRTGEVRGLLCHRCNRGLVWFGDDPGFLRWAAEYLYNAPRMAPPPRPR